jgi:transcriptional regulator with XRE-family HTH domain
MRGRLYYRLVKSIDPEVRAVGDAVGAIRRALGWSQRGLALRAGVSQSHVSDIENCRLTHLTFETAVKLLAANGSAPDRRHRAALPTR